MCTRVRRRGDSARPRFARARGLPRPPRGLKMSPARMHMRAWLPLLRMAVALAVAVLACGNGLPGLVGALSESADHVCTCASGGSHASCPVCNRAVLGARPAKRPHADGIPCGDRRAAVGVAGEPGVLPAGRGDAGPVLARASVVVEERLP